MDNKNRTKVLKRSDIFKKIIFVALISVFKMGCNSKLQHKNMEKEVLLAETNFAKMAAEKGIAEAFAYYAANEAVIKRENDTLIKGKENIKAYYQAKDLSNAKLSWSPDFIDVSQCGTLAYSYGHYSFILLDESGNEKEYTGVFHTVWKKQKNGEWKYVWD